MVLFEKNLIPFLIDFYRKYKKFIVKNYFIVKLLFKTMKIKKSFFKSIILPSFPNLHFIRLNIITNSINYVLKLYFI